MKLLWVLLYTQGVATVTPDVLFGRFFFNPFLTKPLMEKACKN